MLDEINLCSCGMSKVASEPTCFVCKLYARPDEAKAFGQSIQAASIRKFNSGATRDSDIDAKTGLPKPDYHRFLCPKALSYFCEKYMLPNRKMKDGSYRDPDNWKKGFPMDVLMASKSRHYWETWRLWDEGSITSDLALQSLSAELFNTMAMMRQILEKLEE